MRFESQSLEVVAGYQRAVDADRRARGAELDRDRKRGQDALESRIVTAQFAIKGMREIRLRPFGEARARVGRLPVVEPAKIGWALDGKGPPESGVHHAEDGRIGADSGGERQHSDGSEGRRLAESSCGIAEVVKQIHRSRVPPDLVTDLDCHLRPQSTGICLRLRSSADSPVARDWLHETDYYTAAGVEIPSDGRQHRGVQMAIPGPLVSLEGGRFYPRRRVFAALYFWNERTHSY